MHSHIKHKSSFTLQVIFREDSTTDELIDVISGNRVYLPCLYVYNKIDQVSIEEVDRVAHLGSSVVVRWVGVGCVGGGESLLDLICLFMYVFVNQSVYLYITGKKLFNLSYA